MEENEKVEKKIFKKEEKEKQRRKKGGDGDEDEEEDKGEATEGHCICPGANGGWRHILKLQSTVNAVACTNEACGFVNGRHILLTQNCNTLYALS